jgi:hypothetical protein
MKRRTVSADEPQGRLRAVKDDLPPPRELVPHENSIPVTVSLSREAAEFYRLEAAKAGLPIHRFIRRMLESWLSATPVKIFSSN